MAAAGPPAVVVTGNHSLSTTTWRVADATAASATHHVHRSGPVTCLHEEDRAPVHNGPPAGPDAALFLLIPVEEVHPQRSVIVRVEAPLKIVESERAAPEHLVCPIRIPRRIVLEGAERITAVAAPVNPFSRTYETLTGVREVRVLYRSASNRFDVRDAGRLVPLGRLRRVPLGRLGRRRIRSGRKNREESGKRRRRRQHPPQRLSSCFDRCTH